MTTKRTTNQSDTPKHAAGLAAHITALIEPIITALSYELWGCEVLNPRGSCALRIYIDKPGGVTIDDCAQVSREIATAIAVDDPIASAYQLEVSSPGIERPLFTPAQYARYIGEPVAIKLRYLINNRRRVRGRLAAVKTQAVIVDLGEDEALLIPFSAIDKAHLDHEYRGS